MAIVQIVCVCAAQSGAASGNNHNHGYALAGRLSDRGVKQACACHERIHAPGFGLVVCTRTDNSKLTAFIISEHHRGIVELNDLSGPNGDALVSVIAGHKPRSSSDDMRVLAVGEGPFTPLALSYVLRSNRLQLKNTGEAIAFFGTLMLKEGCAAQVTFNDTTREVISASSFD